MVGDAARLEFGDCRIELQTCCVDVYGGVYWKWGIKHTDQTFTTECLKFPEMEEILSKDEPFWVSPDLLKCFGGEEDGISTSIPTLEKQ